MNLLSIGGSDPSSGAGIQSDVKTFESLNAYGLTAVTAITGQNTSKFGDIQPVSKKNFKNQIDLLLEDFSIDGIKIGMVYNSEIIKTIYHTLKKIDAPIIVDPVIKSTTGGMLIQKSALRDFKKYLMPMATVITPNKFEAEFLSNRKITSKTSLIKVGRIIQEIGVKNVVITGVELKKGKVSDFILNENSNFIENKKIKIENHGSGCNYSAAMIVSLAQGKSVLESAKFAQLFTFDSIKGARKIGRGIAITQISDKRILELSDAIKQLAKIKNISQQIPECQTNFVYSKKFPKSTKDVLGISGRIVKTGNNIVVAGNLEYGGSKHVATAVLSVKKKFPGIHSAINLKFQKETIDKLKENGFSVKNYDRTKEPKSIKNKEGSSIGWGIKESLKNVKNPPDVIFHKGDFGKEPMIIIFGTTPKSVLEKISKIFN